MMMSKLPALLLTVASPALLTGSPPPDKMPLASTGAASTTRLDGCAPAPSNRANHILYLDAGKGSDVMGNGSSARPWQSLRKALPQLHDGDVLRMRNGDYGPLHISNRMNGATVTIEADVGAHPHVDQISFNNASYWRIRGLTAAPSDGGANQPGPNMFLVHIGGDHHEIRIEDNNLTSYPQTGWTQQDYTQRTPSGIREIGRAQTGCVYIEGNKLENIGNGIATSRSRQVAIIGNRINRFVYDGINFGSSQLVIRDNVITNRINGGDATKVHPDFIQGFPAWHGAGEPDEPLSDVLIERNIGIVQTDPDLPFAKVEDPTFLVQGITIFDGDWSRVTVRNNLIITRAFNGITLMGVHDSQIVNNTLLGYDPRQKMMAWIAVNPAKPNSGGAPSSNVLVANNITTGLLIDPRNDKITVTHNLVLQADGPSRRLYWTQDAMLNPRDANKPGLHGLGNVIDPRTYAAIFRRFDPARAAFDARVKPGLKLPVKPDMDAMPAQDITGAKRQGTPVIGAFGEAP
jgi:hypothetical protein